MSGSPSPLQAPGESPLPTTPQGPPLKIAVIGSGISGLSCAWLLSQRHQVHLYEAEGRLGGHSHTVEASVAAGAVPVDMGFIVYNEINYPNLTALFDHLGVATEASNMGFAVSLDEGRVEYGGDSLPALFAQWRNLASPRFWRMLVDLTRFYREAPGEAAALEADMTSLGDYLDRRGYGRAFQDDHLLPQAAAIWSTSTKAMRDYPAAAFIRFCDNHGLLKIVGRPTWRTVTGGSRSYVQRLAGALGDRVHLNAAATSLRRLGDGVRVLDAAGREARYDQVVIAAHADQALAMMADATARERRVLGAFGYSRNDAVLHTDDRLMPTRRKTWSAWNYVGETGAAGGAELCVTYWMNRLQNLPGETPLFVTLNPYRAPDPAKVLRRESFTHPLYDAAALRAQAELWSLQGQGGLWWCGAYFGAGFHEDGLQSGLAVAEALGGVRRPWTVANESGRIRLATGATASDRPAKAA